MMSDEFTIDAKYKRDSLVDEHYRYEQALERIAAPLDGDVSADVLMWQLFDRIDIARRVLERGP